MQLVRIGAFEQEKPAILIEGRYLDVSEHIRDYNEAFFAADGLGKLAHILATKDLPEIKNPPRIGSCVARPSKIICVGLNYADHARETGAEIPQEPILFFKSTTALCGPNDNVIIPKGSEKTDWEVELAIVIGKKAQYVSEAEAYDYVAGYCLHNDYSEREYHLPL
jgi:2,4-diketo-3-deoxy-L-fuconate hydrolase